MHILKRKVNPKSDFGKQLRLMRSLSPLHTIEIELKVSPEEHRKLKQVNEELRIIRNTIMGVMYKNYKQMSRLKEYKLTMKNYINGDEKQKKEMAKKFEELRLEYDLTFEFSRKYGEYLRKTKFSLPDSVTVLSICEMVWFSMEGLFYRGSNKVRFYKRGEFVTLQGKQANRSIILKHGFVTFAKLNLPLKPKKDDLFIEETLANINQYKVNGVYIDKLNVDNHLNKKPLKSSYRIRNNRIVSRCIRGKLRYFLHVVLEGNPVVKRDKDGSFRHTYGVGKVSGDIGTQSLAIKSKDKCILKNFAERAEKTFKQERKVQLIQRKMERSRRAMNPDKFGEEGQYIRNSKPWIFSKNYKKLKNKHQNLHRKTAANRNYAHNEDVNDIRALGDEFIIEKMNIAGLKKRTKKTTINNKTGKFNKKKRFGKSIQNRSPGYFIAKAKERFIATGGSFKEVNTWTFKASQYDHVLNDYAKKILSERWHIFPDGTKVQRDLYSAFLLYCTNDDLQTPNKKLCDLEFSNFIKLHDKCIKGIKDRRKAVLNSGL